MNGQHIRLLSLDDLYARVKDFWPLSANEASEAHKKTILSLVQDRLKTLKDLPILTEYFFTEPIVEWSMISENKQLSQISREDINKYLEAARDALSKSEFDPESIQTTLNSLLEATGQKPDILFSLVRIAVSWAPFSPALNDTLSALGREVVISRLNTAITY